MKLISKKALVVLTLALVLQGVALVIPDSGRILPILLLTIALAALGWSILSPQSTAPPPPPAEEDPSQVVVNAAPVMVWMSGINNLCNFFNRPWLEFTGRTLEQERGHGWAEGVYPGDLRQCMHTYISAFADRRAFKMVYRLKRADGEYRWILNTGGPRFSPHGDFMGYMGTCIDITDDKFIEQELKSSESRLSLVFNHVSDFLCLVGVGQDGSLRTLAVNRALISATEFSERELMDKTLEEILPGPVGFLWASRCNEAIRSRREIKGGERFFPGGMDTAVEYTLTPISDDFGRCGHVLLAARRASDSEEDLRKSKDHLKIILRGIADTVTAIDASGKMIFASEAAATTMGFGSARELLQADPKSILDRYELTDEEGNPFPLSRLPNRLALQGASSPETVLCHRNKSTGEERWTRLRAMPVLDDKGNVQVVITTAHDITDQRRMEASRLSNIQLYQELKNSEEKYRSLFERSLDGIYRSSPEGKFVDLNHALVNMLGYADKEELLKEPEVEEYFSQLHRQSPDRRARARPIALKRKDGSMIWVENNSQAILDSDGSTLYYEGIVRDVTERRHAEEALRESEEQFRQSQKMEAVGRLAGGVAHDFNNLLMTINGYCEFGLGLIDGSHPLRRPLEQIMRSGERAASLTRQLLAYSRKQVLLPKVLNLNTVLSDMDKMLQRLIGEDIDLVNQLDRGLGLIKADPGQIEQVVLNLVVNARDAMPQGGRITIRTSNIELEEGVKAEDLVLPPGSYALLSIIDTGSGLNDQVKAHLFEPFFTTKEVGKGTGLGLSTVYGIIKQSGGGIQVVSEVGKGADFKIYLPLVGLEADAATTRSSYFIAKPTSSNETVLLVEDEDSVRILLHEVLQGGGYNVLSASGGAEALSLSEQYDGPIHLLLTDVVMTQMGGRILAECLNQVRPDTKILYMSGYTDDAIVRHGVVDSGTNFIQKPFKRAHLINKIREILDPES